MAEILEGPKEWSRDVQCEHEDCKARFRVKTEDVKRYTDAKGYPMHYTACPSCGTTMDLEHLPPTALSAAKKAK